MTKIVISGTGLYTPQHQASNAELVASLSVAVKAFNAEHADEIESGEMEPRDEPSERFIVKASGVQNRYLMEKEGVLDPTRMRPRFETRSEDQDSIQCEISVAAIRDALAAAGRRPEDVDAILLACSNIQRAYPAVAVEVQNALGARGWAFDLNVACSSATFALQTAVDAVRSGSAKCAIVVNPEITSGHNNFWLREYHFIFGDACTALVVERAEDCQAESAFEVLSTRLETKFSNNIRNDSGFLNVCEVDPRPDHELVFRQRGRAVFREVCPMVVDHISGHLKEHGLQASDLKRMWLHQANLSMNQLIAKSLLGRNAEPDEAPVILDEYANTSSAGSVIAFHRFRDDFESGDLGVLCSFGAGYSIGSLVLRRV